MGLVTICGATATGKSGLAIALAQRLETVILSADSRQVYREFDIGTAKPTQAEQALVPHYLIDLCDPTKVLTLADYQAQAQVLIAEKLIDLTTPVLLVGGTGLYIKSILRGMKIPRVAPQPELRSQFQALGQGFCYQLLQQVDSLAAKKIHPNDEARTQRALEVFYVSGHPISAQQGESPPPYPVLQIGLSMKIDDLTHCIQRRTEMMIELGLVKEVKTLCQKYGLDLPLLKTLGYAEIQQYLAGDLTLSAAIDLTVLHTRQFAKRQRTWFRADPDIEWFDAKHPNLLEQVWERIQDFVKGSS
ncbi:MAG: tRNA (adenosine(37)-N6)-dimethylallyltransferase MiaA [Microcoleaceae cyanobacterium]